MNQCFTCFKENWMVSQTPVKLTWSDKTIVVTFPITKKTKETQGSFGGKYASTHVQIKVSEIFFQMEKYVHLKLKNDNENKRGLCYSDSF